MRRQIFMWTGGIVVLAALAVAAFAGPKAPFDFLNDRTPVYKTEQVKTWNYYSYKADYPLVIEQAREELPERCFSPAYDMAGCQESVSFERLKGGPIRDVRIMRDWSMDRAGEQAKAKGWVTVITEGPRADAPIDRFRAWLGL